MTNTCADTYNNPTNLNVSDNLCLMQVIVPDIIENHLAYWTSGFLDSVKLPGVEPSLIG